LLATEYVVRDRYGVYAVVFIYTYAASETRNAEK
jgi:hypothetical protein